MNYIATWLCADEKGEESIFPQTGQKSSSQSHQNIYWRCLILFYATSKRFNKAEKHLLFTNVKTLPTVDGRDVQTTLDDLGVEVIFTDFKYKTPKGYFGMFQNQFYEFSILEYIATNYTEDEDNFLIVDSDCIFIRPAQALFSEARKQGFLSFEDDCTEDLVIHGLSRKDMGKLYADLLGREVNEVPGYHLGEFFLASLKNVKTIFNSFLELWPELLRRYEAGLPKFNEEAHTLSYIYYKNGFIASPKRNLMKRIWTNPVFYRNVDPADNALVLWHLPSEKTFGLADLYQVLIRKSPNYGLGLSNNKYQKLVEEKLCIPHLPLAKKIKYYLLSYYRALRKRIKKFKLANSFKLAYE
ncbi:hypothetical protein MUY27_15010 [Mucilaginibacter sp. RS28]|uniref:Uncharacterized protein n=1 Tax=Mucilaginibacter straminoryzae TaxID=2932774 RepID=A0A9X1X4F4_9SPHI|nr:hypothetical protein [Mucilaginibacter straminoryzae]MCJ8211027.1 hypothetical protein [Mucilaginibacter straminoryzae]